jgi:Domain of unknown function (DUF5916)/Carbohydrate family 9 binding domain-like
MKFSLPLLLVLCAHCAMAQNDSIPRKKYVTQKLNGTITIDGVLNEEGWNAIEWGGDFIQVDPNGGQPPGQPTSFKILYDEKYLYIAYRCHDVSPDSIIKRMSRRDEFPGDWVEINIDSYHDKRTAFSFTLSVSGVRGDEFVSNDGNNWDASWNPIWFSKTAVDDKGWTGEVKIPLSQLRYGNEKDKVWGIQFTRRLFRKEERSTWQYIPQGSGVWVSAFGELHGLKDIPFHRQVEIAPYVTAQIDKYESQPGNPFADGTDAKVAVGVDGKVAVTNDLILDFTINPDFGQVEADPSQVRIDGFQNFFDERRPFFIESRNIFNYQLTGSIAGGDYDADLLFYSRRIGSSPHGFPALGPDEYVDMPQNTSILGAAKFSGKTKKGLSIGILESVTQREMATIDKNGERREEMVEPLTNFFVARLQKDYNKANTIIGGIITAVNREKGLDEFLHKGAYSGGFDFIQYWKNRSWHVRANIVFSHVTGTKEAILNTQTAFEHLYHRDNSPEVKVDPTRTSLTGMSGNIMFGKIGGQQGKKGEIWKFETGVTFRTPGLELNDIGFMLTANEINHFTWVGFQVQKPFSVFRRAGLNYNHWLRWDFSGRFIYLQFNSNGYGVFRNNWQVSYGFNWNPFDISNNALRGATALRRPAGLGPSISLFTDSRKKLSGGVNFFTFQGFENTMSTSDFGVSLSYQPFDAFRITFSGNYSYYFRKQDQFVSNEFYNGAVTRSIVGEVKQETLRFTGRFSYNITPDLTIQYYGQPFITRPLYDHFAYVSDPLAKEYDNRFTAYTPAQISFNNGVYSVDENTDGLTDYSFGMPDFNFVQFRSNLIGRWEYKPGSELYLVWSQGNTANAFNELDTPIFESLVDNAFSGQARNIFLIKWTYRFLK